MRTLNLTLSKKPFDVMVTGEKGVEYRTRSQWMLSRLFDQKTLEPKDYTHVRFTNGYGADKPYFVAKFNRWDYARKNYQLEFSNGLLVNVMQGYVQIYLGEIIETGNLKTAPLINE